MKERSFFNLIWVLELKVHCFSNEICFHVSAPFITSIRYHRHQLPHKTYKEEMWFDITSRFAVKIKLYKTFELNAVFVLNEIQWHHVTLIERAAICMVNCWGTCGPKINCCLSYILICLRCSLSSIDRVQLRWLFVNQLIQPMDQMGEDRSISPLVLLDTLNAAVLHFLSKYHIYTSSPEQTHTHEYSHCY